MKRRWLPIFSFVLFVLPLAAFAEPAALKQDRLKPSAVDAGVSTFDHESPIDADTKRQLLESEWYRNDLVLLKEKYGANHPDLKADPLAFWMEHRAELPRQIMWNITKLNRPLEQLTVKNGKIVQRSFWELRGSAAAGDKARVPTKGGKSGDASHGKF